MKIESKRNLQSFAHSIWSSTNQKFLIQNSTITYIQYLIYINMDEFLAPNTH